MKRRKLTFRQKQKIVDRFIKKSEFSNLIISKNFLDSNYKIKDSLGYVTYKIPITTELKLAVLYGLQYMEEYLSDD